VDTATPASCASCSAPFEGRFCPRCGERRLEPDAFTVRHYLGESVSVVTDLDSTLWRSLGALVARPGHLTAEYLRGRRVAYLRPVQLFLLCNILYFLLQPLAGFDSLTTGLEVQTNHLRYSGWVAPVVEARVAAGTLGAEEYERIFDATLAAQARTLVAAIIPIFAVFVAALHPRRRPLVGHLVFATHFTAFLLLALLAMVPVVLGILYAARVFGTPPGGDALFTSLLVALCVAWLVPALRTAYGASRAAAVLRGFALAVALLVVIQLYRLVLFWTTFLTLGRV
jgi:hypothetical protein